MKIVEVFVDAIGYLVLRVKDLILLIVDIGVEMLRHLYDKFYEINFAEKVIFINIIPAFFAIILPVARFYIFDSYFYINNPLAVYMIGIVIVMFVSLYFPGLFVLIGRLLINGYYLFWIIYLPLAGELTKAHPHEISFGYYLNIAVPFIYFAFSAVSYFLFNER